MSEPIKPSTDAEIAEWTDKIFGVLRRHSEIGVSGRWITMDIRLSQLSGLIARIESDAAKHAAALKERDEQIARLTEALEPFASGSWGDIKAWIVNGAPDREQGLRAAAQLTEFNCAADRALVIRKESNRV